MPLVVMCGRPATGKTTRALQIKAHLETEAKRPVHIVNEETCHLFRNSMYIDSRSEKIGHGTIKAAVDRLLSKEAVVIVDTLNYIRGIRYELYCSARELSTPVCVIFCDTPKARAMAFNTTRHSVAWEQLQEGIDKTEGALPPPPLGVLTLSTSAASASAAVGESGSGVGVKSGRGGGTIDIEDMLSACAALERERTANESETETASEPASSVPDAYASDVLDALWARFEPPNAAHRYESPLFTISPDDTLPLPDIADALLRAKGPRPNEATRLDNMGGTTAMYRWDRLTHDAVAALVRQQQDGALPGDQLAVPHAEKRIFLTRVVSLSELRRIRRNFLKVAEMQQIHETAKKSSRKLNDTFVEYLNAHLKAPK